MPQGNPKPGELYLHFKQKLYQVVTVARHSETGEDLVVYQALYGSFQIYARPFAMFISPVDRDRYPDAGQHYRFQLVETASSSDSEKMPISAERQLDSGEKVREQNPSATKSPEEKLMAFFDAKTMEERYEILLDMREEITDLMINNMAVVLDVVIEEGPLDQRYEELKTCVRTFQKYEVNR